MDKYVLGIDLGTSAVKIILVNQSGKIVSEAYHEYPLIQSQSGFSEQNPEDWISAVYSGIQTVLKKVTIKPEAIEGLSFSGQMHGLVLLDTVNTVLRPAILWNDTRTTKQSQEILQKMRDFISITKNKPLEGFTLPKILWVKENEPETFAKVKTILLPKDYVRFRMTGVLNIDYSDAAGTVMMDVEKHQWSHAICDLFGIPMNILPPLINASDEVGTITKETAVLTGLSPKVRVFAGGADNACGAIGAGIINENEAMCSIGTSGIILTYEKGMRDYHGDIHFFNHALNNAYYSMGVTLSAGYSLSWFKRNFGKTLTMEEFVTLAEKSPVGANRLLFTPYLIGERTPYADSNIRGSFIGLDAMQTEGDFIRAVLEGIVFSLKDILSVYMCYQKSIETIVSIGGGAKSKLWLQMQADIFNRRIITLKTENGPSYGAAMIAAVGLHWFNNFKECFDQFIQVGDIYFPQKENVDKYNEYYGLYQEVYKDTRSLSEKLLEIERIPR
ncbi:xylulokinase [Sporolactobacillus terrae]|uniref:Xylulose kinase n=1 Tax=Sporolactobacillus terrae TaxID=269673 RepID=A0ABX5Q4P5_9BACL|nr:xylulokinase [Sporolactobacillus terrae]QAA21607.1 xylulokinase [Sporolactobacillus terrae]QAA24579.1 xylulokinase [Sporolactobacillus terrae]UAK16416.1 xylulokinase [Sporolactobacillus terrae]